VTDIDLKNPAAQTMPCTETIRSAAEGGGGITVTQRTLLGRWLDMLVRSRTQRAEREIGDLLQSVPDDVLHRAGYQRRQPGIMRNRRSVDDA